MSSDSTGASCLAKRKLEDARQQGEEPLPNSMEELLLIA